MNFEAYASPTPPRPVFREIFAGRARLCRAMQAAGWLTLEAVECYPGGVYRAAHDILRKEVEQWIRSDLMLGAFVYWHFGIDCSSWSLININLNGGTRCRSSPFGDGSLAREAQGNALAAVTLRLIELIHKAGGWWSVENLLVACFGCILVF